MLMAETIAPVPVPVKMEGFSYGTVGIWTGVLMLLGVIVRAWPQLRKIGVESDGSLRSDLMNRVMALEGQVEALLTRIDQERAHHDAQMQIMRHRLNNETHTLDTLLLLLEAAPDRTSDTITKIKELRAQQKLAIAAEQALLTRSKLDAVDGAST